MASANVPPEGLAGEGDLAVAKTRGRTVLFGLSLFVAGLAVAASVGWALVTVTRPAEDPLRATDHTLVEVIPGEVGSSLQLNTVAEWTSAPVGANRAVGVVTGVNVSPGTEVTRGSVLYTVDLRPVVVAQGMVPAFRDLGSGVTGDDMRQLQQTLADLGFYRGQVSGEAGALTTAAIKAWQKSLGMEQTGVVAVGDVIFVPSLPARIVLDDHVVFRGASLVGGEVVLSALPASPEFSIPVTDTQAGMIPTGTRVDITSPGGGIWTGFAGAQSKDSATGTVTVALSGKSGAAICADQCAEVSVTGQATLSSKIITVETVSGLVVPSSALVSGADGKIAVIDEAGQRIVVTVVSAARGMSVIEGVKAGAKVRVPGRAGS